jgi:hypothetical protein
VERVEALHEMISENHDLSMHYIIWSYIIRCWNRCRREFLVLVWPEHRGVEAFLSFLLMSRTSRLYDLPS